MIIGIGTDIIEIKRIAEIIERKGYDAFLERNFTIAEAETANKITLKKKRITYLAKRFAAKEAFAKALGTGIRDLKFKDIGVDNDELGKPFFQLEKAAQNALNKITPNSISAACNISLADTDDLAQAFVVISSVER